MRHCEKKEKKEGREGGKENPWMGQQPDTWKIGVPKVGAEVITEKLSEEIMAGKFPNLMKIINPQNQEAQQIPSTRTTKTTTPCRITIKLYKPVKKRKPEKQPEEKDVCTGT